MSSSGVVRGMSEQTGPDGVVRKVWAGVEVKRLPPGPPFESERMALAYGNGKLVYSRVWSRTTRYIVRVVGGGS